jgi:tetratricopeptide (TPR) repeat protein
MLSRAREVDPASPYVDYWLGEALILEGRFEEAIAAFERVEARAFGAGLKGYCYGRTGRVPEARQLVDGLKSGDPCPALQIALLYLGLQEMENAFFWLERSVELRSLGIHWIKVDPIWDPIVSVR